MEQPRNDSIRQVIKLFLFFLTKLSCWQVAQLNWVALVWSDDSELKVCCHWVAKAPTCLTSGLVGSIWNLCGQLASLIDLWRRQYGSFQVLKQDRSSISTTQGILFLQLCVDKLLFVCLDGPDLRCPYLFSFDLVWGCCKCIRWRLYCASSMWFADAPIGPWQWWSRR